MLDKIIVTNESALKAKYQVAGLTAIKAAIQKLIAADLRRGLKSVSIALDNAASMKKAGGNAVVTPTDPKQNKDAIDAIFKKFAPHYLLILGAPDVVPHQDMQNPVYSATGEDTDKIAFGDIPYACEKPYSKKPEDFIGPTRVVGRVPDLVNSKDVKYLIGVLKTAADYQQRKTSDYDSYFGVSAAVWKNSTALSLKHAFGSNTDLQLVPPKTEQWSKNLISRLGHFINCHGGDTDTHYYGQLRQTYPHALDASLLKGKISKGTVAAAECCYGAQLYDPALAQGQPGICNMYLGEKAYGFFGSTTTAYGMPTGNSAADLICQYFMKLVINGASLGRATLQARQEFAKSSHHISPTDLKTLAQFNLLGDPSLVPVASQNPQPKGLAAAAGLAECGDRRRQLKTEGISITLHSPVARSTRTSKPQPAMQKQLDALSKKSGLIKPVTFSYSIKHPAGTSMLIGKVMTAKAPPADFFHVLMGKTQTKGAPVPQVKVLVAKISAGKIVSVQELHRKS